MRGSPKKNRFPGFAWDLKNMFGQALVNFTERKRKYCKNFDAFEA